VADWVEMDRLAAFIQRPPRAPDLGAICAILFKALAIVELELEPAAQGAFIPAGNAFDAISAISRIVSSAKLELLVVDPYMDEKALSGTAIMAAEGITLRLLSDQAFVKASLKPNATAWVTQYGTRRPLELRLTPAKSLHDRLIIVDGQTVCTLTQSLNAFATRAPASILRVDADTAALKIAAYSALWSAATPA